MVDPAGLIPLLQAVENLDDALPHTVEFAVPRASLVDGSLSFELVISTNEQPLGSWLVTCTGVVENQLALGEICEFEIDDEHVLLLDHRDSRSELYSSSTGTDVTMARAELARAHDELLGGWRPMTRYLRFDQLENLLTYPSALIASGPTTLVDRYQKALQACGTRTSLLVTPHRRWVAGMGWVEGGAPVNALILTGVEPGEKQGGAYVIAQSFVAEPLDP